MRSLPNLSALSTGVCLEPWGPVPGQPPLPPAPTDNGGGRYFYLWHRPADAFMPAPEGVKFIVQTGGVVPDKCKLHPERVLSMRPADMLGFDPVMRKFLKERMNTEMSYIFDEFRHSVAWYYLNFREEEEAWNHASEDELIFRVPEAWLRYNALSCMEWPATTSPEYIAWALVTRLKVPLDYRITSPRQLRDESSRAMTNEEVTNLVYNAHVKEDPKSRERYRPALPSPPSPPSPPQQFSSDDDSDELPNPFALDFSFPLRPPRPSQLAELPDAAPCPKLDPPPGGLAQSPCTREPPR